MKQLFVKNKLKLALALILCCALLQSSVEAQIKVVTTLSSYADIVQSIAADRVDVSAIANPKFNPHFIEPRPSDILKLKRAELFIHSGLDLEAWRAPLLDAAAKSELREGGSRQLDLSQGISLLAVPAGQVSRAEGDIHMFGNPHYWTDPRNGIIIAEHIAAKLSEIDAAGTNLYQDNLQKFKSRLNSKIQQWQESFKPFNGQQVIGYHDEWPYMMAFVGLQMNQFIEPKPGIPPGPQQLEQLEAYIKSKGVKLAIQASYFPKDAGIFLNQKTGIKILNLCQNVGELPQCSDYIAMLDYNFSEILKALQS